MPPQPDAGREEPRCRRNLTPAHRNRRENTIGRKAPVEKTRKTANPVGAPDASWDARSADAPRQPLRRVLADWRVAERHDAARLRGRHELRRRAPRKRHAHCRRLRGAGQDSAVRTLARLCARSGYAMSSAAAQGARSPAEAGPRTRHAMCTRAGHGLRAWGRHEPRHEARRDSPHDEWTTDPHEKGSLA